jgi:arsenate reductase (glutaredoxin)
MNIQIFGTNKSQDTKKALRFFKERSIQPHFVDLQEREMSPGELKRFSDKFGLKALIDEKGKAYAEAGFAHMRVPDEQMTQKLIDDPKLMIQPLVRDGTTLSVGWDEQIWKAWYAENKDDRRYKGTA